MIQVSPTSALGPEWETVKNNSGKRRKIKHKQLRLDEEGSLPSLATSNSFQALSDIEIDEACGEDTSIGTPAKILKKHKPPPIIIHKHLNTPTKSVLLI